MITLSHYRALGHVVLNIEGSYWYPAVPGNRRRSATVSELVAYAREKLYPGDKESLIKFREDLAGMIKSERQLWHEQRHSGWFHPDGLGAFHQRPCLLLEVV